MFKHILTPLFVVAIHEALLFSYIFIALVYRDYKIPGSSLINFVLVSTVIYCLDLVLQLCDGQEEKTFHCSILCIQTHN